VKPDVPVPPWLESAVPTLTRYAELLATTGVEAGLIGPREVSRLWSRHILNCAVVVDPAASFVPPDSVVADVGSGAGLPGLVWAMSRPDLRIVCLEPLLRRSDFLHRCVHELDLSSQVSVVRIRAEDAEGGQFPVVTARAVAPLGKLLGWTVPLLTAGGRLVALKGASAAEEVAGAAEIARGLGMRDLRIAHAGAGVVEPPTTLVLGTRSS
jgi:16S rRNA (guanine527-N7)-methyltransferase